MLSFIIYFLHFTMQASQVYQSMTIESLYKMIPFFDFSVVEKISVDAVKHKFLTMKIDHMNGAVSFSILVSYAIQHIRVSLSCIFFFFINALLYIFRMINQNINPIGEVRS